MKNYTALLWSKISSHLADELSQSKTVLTWLAHSLQVPVSIVSFFVPLRESGSMLPQIFLAPVIKKYKYRKKIWMIGAIAQSVSLLGIVLVSFVYTALTLGIFILMFLLLFSLGRSLCSIVSKDVVGKTVAKSSRGRLSGDASGIASIAVVIGGVFLTQVSDLEIIRYLVLGSVLLWMVSLFFFSHIDEPESEVENANKASVKDMIEILRKDNLLQQFIFTRSLLLCSALTIPFYVILAQEAYASVSELLAYVLIATSVASIIGGPLLGRYADVSSKKTMFYGALFNALIGVVSVVLIELVGQDLGSVYVYPLIIFLLSMSYQAVRIGRKTYIINIAEGNDRTNYVAISNTAIGIVLLVVGGISSILSSVSVPLAIFILSIIGLYGSYMSYSLKDAQESIVNTS